MFCSPILLPSVFAIKSISLLNNHCHWQLSPCCGVTNHRAQVGCPSFSCHPAVSLLSLDPACLSLCPDCIYPLDLSLRHWLIGHLYSLYSIFTHCRWDRTWTPSPARKSTANIELCLRINVSWQLTHSRFKQTWSGGDPFINSKTQFQEQQTNKNKKPEVEGTLSS